MSEVTTTPPYLIPPVICAEAAGTLSYDVAHNQYRIRADPYVYELAKRVFPGCETRDGSVVFKATHRAVGELNWLMMRFPLRIEQPDAYAGHLREATKHAAIKAKPPVMEKVEGDLFCGELMAFQKDGVPFLIHNERCLLADQQGLGKTVQAIAGFARTQAFPVLIVCPASIMLQWEAMIRKFMVLTRPKGTPRNITFLRGLKPYGVPASSIYVTHYGLLRGWKEKLPTMGLQTVIFDEAQELRHIGTEKYSAASLVAREAKYVWLLSGTPVYNHGDEIWSVLNIAEYHCLGDRDSFTREWCMGYGATLVAKPEILGDYLRREGLMLRRRVEEVLTELPPRRRIVMTIGKEEDTYARLISRAVRLARGYEGIKVWSERGRIQREIELEARRATGCAKAPYVAEFVRTLLEGGERVLLFAYHHDVHDTLNEHLRAFNPVKVTGHESAAEKEVSVMSFASGKTNLIQLSLRATAGLDGLQGRGTCVVMAELDYSPAVHAQCETRLHRTGYQGKESVLCYYLVCDAGSDEIIQEALGLKVGQFVGLMGDKAETPEDRAVAQQTAQHRLKKLIDRLAERSG